MKNQLVLLFCFILLLPSGTVLAEDAENPYMAEAIDKALDGIFHGHGGLFDCVIV